MKPAWQYVAADMADMYEYYQNEGHVSINVASAMGDLFETVPLDHRAQVFMDFCKELDKRELPYNAPEFQEGEPN